VIAAALALTLAAALAGGGTMHHYRIDAPVLHDPHRSVRVYLPPSYDAPEAAERRYPVAYFLHGWPGSDNNWVKKGRAPRIADSLIAQGRIPELLMVFPDGRGRGVLGRSLYMDSADTTSLVETFLARDLIAWVDQTFRTIADPAHRAVIGMSDGGTGAMNMGLRHPDVYGACASHSGEFLIEKPFGMGAMLGHGPGAERILFEHSPMDYAADVAERVRGMVIYFDCGLDDGAIEDNRAFHARLDSLGIDHDYREFEGKHTWSYWRAHLVQSLEAVTAGMGSKAPPAPPAR
jgi:enterochelin esterase-like enzyme